MREFFNRLLTVVGLVFATIALVSILYHFLVPEFL